MKNERAIRLRIDRSARPARRVNRINPESSFRNGRVGLSGPFLRETGISRGYARAETLLCTRETRDWTLESGDTPQLHRHHSTHNQEPRTNTRSQVEVHNDSLRDSLDARSYCYSLGRSRVSALPLAGLAPERRDRAPALKSF